MSSVSLKKKEPRRSDNRIGISFSTLWYTREIVWSALFSSHLIFPYASSHQGTMIKSLVWGWGSNKGPPRIQRECHTHYNMPILNIYIKLQDLLRCLYYLFFNCCAYFTFEGIQTSRDRELYTLEKRVFYFLRKHH